MEETVLLSNLKKLISWCKSQVLHYILLIWVHSAPIFQTYKYQGEEDGEVNWRKRKHNSQYSGVVMGSSKIEDRM